MANLKKIVEYKKSLSIVCIALIILIYGGLYVNIKKVKLRATVFESAVHEDVSTKADTYLKNVKKDSKVAFKESKLNNTKLGIYDVQFKFEGDVYSVSIKIVDKEKPVIKLHTNKFAFNLKATAKDVNKEINKNLIVTDNYDKVFNDVNVINKIPISEKEIVFDFSVKDTSDNTSEPVEIKIQFTKDGKEKSDLLQERKTMEVALNENEGSSTKSATDKTIIENKDIKSDTSNNKDKLDNSKSSVDNSGVANSSNSNGNTASDVNQVNENTSNEATDTVKPNKSPKPPERSKPSEQPRQPVEKPKLTVDNCPAWLRHGAAKLFATYEQAQQWYYEQAGTEGSPYYGMNGDIGTINDGEYVGSIYGVFFD